MPIATKKHCLLNRRHGRSTLSESPGKEPDLTAFATARGSSDQDRIQGIARSEAFLAEACRPFRMVRTAAISVITTLVIDLFGLSHQLLMDGNLSAHLLNGQPETVLGERQDLIPPNCPPHTAGGQRTSRKAGGNGVLPSPYLKGAEGKGRGLRIHCGKWSSEKAEHSHPLPSPGGRGEFVSYRSPKRRAK